MDFFSDLSKKISDASNATVEYTKKVGEVSKLKEMIVEEEMHIRHGFEKLGQKYFETHKEEVEHEFKEEVDEIKAHLEKVKEHQKKISCLKGIHVCPTCGKEVDKDATYCKHCGSKLPECKCDEEKEEKEETVVEEKTVETSTEEETTPTKNEE